MNTDGEIIVYQSDDATEIEVRIEDETVWMTQAQIADLFGVKQPAISKHLKNIFTSGELSERSVYSILEYTDSDGKSYKTGFYSLDAILSIGYRVNSKNATQFRIWANRILKDYLMHGYALNQRIDRLERKMAEHDQKGKASPNPSTRGELFLPQGEVRRGLWNIQRVAGGYSKI